MIKLLFIIESLGGGGAERVLPNLLKYLSEDKYSITLLTLFANGINLKRVPANVRCVCRQAFCFRGITYFIRLFSPRLLYSFYVKRALPKEEFDVVIAYMHGLPTKIAAGASCKKVTWLHGNLLGGYTPPLRRNFLTFAGMRSCLSRLDAVVGVSQVICDSFQKYTGIKKTPLLIHNTNDMDEIRRLANASSPCQKTDGCLEIVTVGHLQNVKGNDRLLQAARRLKEEGFSFHITILGEGPERPALENFLQENGLREMVSLPGHITNPYPYIKNADLYICPSRSEGFSTAVSEAVILGLPVVSTRVSGATEILGEHDDFGIVCNNSAEGIHEGLKTMLENPELRQHYAEQSRKRAAIFDPVQTVGDVDRLLTGLCSR